jgi:hypothetical protein
MKRLLFILLAVATFMLGTAQARDHVSVAIGGPDFAVSYSNGYGYYAPRPVYVAPAYYGPRVIYYRHHRACPPGYYYVPPHYSRYWHHWRYGACRPAGYW